MRQQSQLRQYQVKVAKLMPEIAFFKRFSVRDFKMRASSQSLQHCQMCRERFMQTGQHTIDRANATLRRNKYVCPALTRMRYPTGICYRLQRSHDGRTNGNDALVCLMG